MALGPDARGLRDAVASWDRHGFVLLPGWVALPDLEPALSELHVLFPTPEEFHSDPDAPRHDALRTDEYAGLVRFPFASVELCLLAVHPELVRLARTFLRTADIRIYSAEAWAKFTGAVDYEQPHHRDYLNHTVVVPSHDARHRNLEMFVFLNDVTEGLGPTQLVSTVLTDVLPLLPHEAPRSDHPRLYEVEVPATGPAGTVLAYRGETMHRATDLTAPKGARYTLHCSFRPAADEWVGREGWGARSFDPAWDPFVWRASPGQLELFGFPSPGHPFWTRQTLDDFAVRYPALDTTPWRDAARATREGR